MNKGSQRSMGHQTRRQEAREWFVIRQPRQDLPPALQKKWEKWVADNRNLTVFREYERVDILLRALPRRPLPTDEQLHATRRAAAHRPGAAAAAAAKDPPLSAFLARLRDTVSVAALSRVSIAIATSALVAGIVIFGPDIYSRLFPTKARTYQTAPGHLLTVTLPDRSVIKLGGASRLSLLLSNETRHVTLYEGEAMFDVTHNPQAPFEVDVDATRVTDRGTAFHVRRYRDKQVIVGVVKGSVDVAPRQRVVTEENAVAAGQAGTTAASQRLASVTVTEGQAVSSDATGRITPAHPADFQAVAWWLYGRRVYREKPLGRVIEDLQLYFPRQIEFDRTQVGSMPFTGILDPNNPEESLHGLEVVLPVEIDESDPQRVVIRCRRGGCRQQ